MTRRQPEPRVLQALPTGRFLYRTRPDDLAPCAVLMRRGSEFWIVPGDWKPGGRAAGPYRRADALRALRIANTLAVQGCELDANSWHRGLVVLGDTALPDDLNAWTRIDAGLLPPSVSTYSNEEIASEGSIADVCCAPPRDWPRIKWQDDAAGADLEEARVHLEGAHPNRSLPLAGRLRTPWNAHPIGSPVFATSRELDGLFAIVDLPSGLPDR